MKKIFLPTIILLVILSTVIICTGKEQINNFGNPTKFNKEVYYLTFARTSPEFTINEYTREGETVHNWNKLIAIRYYKTSIDLEKFVKDTYEIERGGYTLLSSRCNKNVALIGFIMKGPDYLEYNCWKYMNLGDTLVSVQYAEKFKFNKENEFTIKLVEQIIAYHKKIRPIMNRDLNVAVEFENIGKE